MFFLCIFIDQQQLIMLKIHSNTSQWPCNLNLQHPGILYSLEHVIFFSPLNSMFFGLLMVEGLGHKSSSFATDPIWENQVSELYICISWCGRTILSILRHVAKQVWGSLTLHNFSAKPKISLSLLFSHVLCWIRGIFVQSSVSSFVQLHRSSPDREATFQAWLVFRTLLGEFSVNEYNVEFSFVTDVISFLIFVQIILRKSTTQFL